MLIDGKYVISLQLRYIKSEMEIDRIVMCVIMDEQMKMMTCNGEVSSAMRLQQRLEIRSQLWTSVMLLPGGKVRNFMYF
ncbi:hypothetical protein Hanom_Chr06g00566521 [Helianthus anomalus]